MREIKFRGKTQGGRLIYGDLITYESGQAAIIEKQLSEYGYEATEIARRTRVDPDSVGQFTGLKDKSGLEIYEGDVVRVTQVRPKAETPKDRGVCEVKFSIWNGWCIGTRWDRYAQSPDNPIDILEVIGNIHDNPELLKGGSNE